MTVKMVDLYKQYQTISNDIDKAIADVIADSAFVRGRAITDLENDISNFLGTKHCISCGSGTDAITLALMAIGLSKGDEVILPAFTFAAAAEAVALLGGTPVFADVDKTTFNIDTDSVERLISKHTKAIIPVHLFGQPCDNMNRLIDIATDRNIFVIEDNAQAFGAECHLHNGTTAYAGTIGHIGCTSFFPTKVLGCFGDGGALFTNNDILAEKIRSLANHGQTARYQYRYIGLNSRLDTIQAAVLRAKLPHLKKWIDARRKAAHYYSEALKNIPFIKVPHESAKGSHVYHQYTIKVTPQYRDRLRSALDTAGIPSMIYYPVPLYMQPAYSDICIYDRQSDNSLALSECVLSLPIHSELTHSQQDLVIDTIKSFFEKTESDNHCYD